MRQWTPKGAISFYLPNSLEEDIRLLAYASNQSMSEFMTGVCQKLARKNRDFLDEFKEVAETSRKRVRI